MIMSSNSSKEKKARPVQCVVTSDKMQQSRVGLVENFVKHPVYGKYQVKRTRIMFHDEKNNSKVGDKVLIVPSRPFSARKRFQLLEVVERN